MQFKRNVPRWARLRMQPAAARVGNLLIVCCYASLWGLAWLPGGRILAAIIVVPGALLAGYLILHETSAWFLRKWYVQPPPTAAYRTRWLVLAPLLIILWVNPAALMLKLSLPFFGDRVRNSYEHDPAIFPTLHPGFYGPFWVDDVIIEPSGVHLHVPGSGYINYTDENGFWLDASRNQFELWPHLH